MASQPLPTEPGRVDEPQEDLEIPGEDYTFGTLIRAQADGDLQTLRSHGLDAVRAGKEIL